MVHPLSGLWCGIRRDDSLEVSLRSRDPFSVLDLSCFLCILPELYYLFDLDFELYSCVDVFSVLDLDFVSL